MFCKYFQPINAALQVESFFRIEKMNTEDESHQADLILPDCTPGLMVILTGGFSRIDALSSTALTSDKVFLFGQKTKAVKYEYLSRASRAIGVKLRPESIHRLFGISAHEITDRVINLDEILPQANDFLSQIPQKTDPCETLNEWVHTIGRQQRGSEAPPLLRSMLRQMHHSDFEYSIANLAAINQTGYKKIDRLFRRHIGLSPKLYARIVRLNQCMLARQQNKKQRLTDIAYQSNFFDQTHFTKEVKHLTGMLPSEIFNRQNTPGEKEQLDFLQRRIMG